MLLNMIGKADSQECFSWCFSLLFLAAALVSPLAFFRFLSSSCFFSLLITIPVLFLSTVFFVKFSKRKKRVCLDENPIQEEKVRDKFEEEVTENPQLSTLVDTQEQEGGEAGFTCKLMSLPWETETSSESVASDSLEDHWVSSNHMGSNGSVSDESLCSDDDGYDDDEENGLIEITLMGCCGSNGLVEEPRQKQKQNLQNFLAESVCREEELMEIRDMIEEENLIEIDISMGSIKRSFVSKQKHKQLNLQSFLAD